MKYTIDDLRGKYVKVGTPECEIFMNACDKLGVGWTDGSLDRNKLHDKECISLNRYVNILNFGISQYYQNNNCWDLFVPHSVESSAVKTRKCHSLMCENTVEGNVGTYCGCNHAAVDEIDNIVTQRGERYGLFADGAVIMQDLKTVMRATPGWERLTPSQREALEMIQHKIGRVLNGDPTYDDSWRDISGYSTLILNELNGVKR